MIIGLDASRAVKAQRTGTETYALELIKQFARLASAQHRLRLYTPQPPPHDHWPESPYIETRLIPAPRLWTHGRLAWELHRQPPNVLFVPSHVLPIYCPVPAIVTVHDLGYRHYPDAHGRFQRWYLNWTTRRHSRVANHIIADSYATQADLIRYYQADPRRITVVHLGRDEKLQRADNLAIAAMKAQYQLTGDYLLYLGTLQPRKNLLRLLAAFQHVIMALDNSSLQLVIAGSKGWLYEPILAEVARLGLSERVIFTGYVTTEAKAALLSGALAYLFPSLYEGFGLPILEAMACGTPVLTSNNSSLPEVAGDAAIMVNPHHTAEIAAGIIALVTNPLLRHELITKGYQQVNRFSWECTAQQIWEILLDIAIKRNANLT